MTHPLWILGGIFGLAAFLRIYKLSQRRLLLWDDGLRLREAVFVQDLLVFLKNHLGDLLRKKIEFKEAVKSFRGRFLFENPLSIFLYAFASLATGNAEQSAYVTNAVFSLLGILGIHFIGALIGGPAYGLTAAFLLAISTYHLMYSRSVHAEVTAGAFYVWATYFYFLSYAFGVRSELSFILLFLAGLFAGAAFCCNARQIHIPPLFFAFEIIRQIFYFNGFFFPRMFILTAGLALPFFAINGFLSVLKELGYPYWSFLKQIYERSGHASKPDLLFRSGWIYLKTIVQCEGPIFPVLAGYGLWRAAAGLQFEGLFIAAQFLAPLLLWSARPPRPQQVRSSSMGAYQYPVPRLISSFIYPGVILAAYGLWGIPSRFFWYVLVLTMIVPLWNAARLIRQRSGYKDAIRFIEQNSDGRHFTNVFEISAFYVGNDKAFNIYDLKPQDVEEIRRRQNVRHFLFVPSIHKNTCLSVPIGPFEEIVSKSSPQYAVDVGMGEFKPLLVDEHNNLSPEVFRPNQIQIYEIPEVPA